MSFVVGFPCVMLASVLPIAAVVVGAKQKKIEATTKPFIRYLSTCVNIEELEKHRPVEEPYILGKVVLVDIPPGPDSDGATTWRDLREALVMEDWQQINHRESLKLLAELRETSHGEVGTIICLRWGREKLARHALRLTTEHMVPGTLKTSHYEPEERECSDL